MDNPRDQRDSILASLPPAPQPVAHYTPVREANGLLFLAGQTPHVQGHLEHRGLVGVNVSLEDAQAMARLAALNVLALLTQHTGGLDRVESIVSMTGYVACGPDFSDHPLVMNGASDVFVAVFGEAGAHARASVGVSSLPGGAPVEISVIASVRS